MELQPLPKWLVNIKCKDFEGKQHKSDESGQQIFLQIWNNEHWGRWIA